MASAAALKANVIAAGGDAQEDPYSGCHVDLASGRCYWFSGGSSCTKEMEGTAVVDESASMLVLTWTRGFFKAKDIFVDAEYPNFWKGEGDVERIPITPEGVVQWDVNGRKEAIAAFDEADAAQRARETQ